MDDSSVVHHLDLEKKLNLFMITVYSANSIAGKDYPSRLPIAGMPVIERTVSPDAALSKPVAEDLGVMDGFDLSNMITNYDGSLRYVRSEHGLKLEVVFGEQAADGFLTEQQTLKVLKTLARLPVKVVKAYANDQGINLIASPLVGGKAQRARNSVAFAHDGTRPAIALPIQTEKAIA